MLKAGVAETDLSPPTGASLGGYPHHDRLNEGVHDPLMGSCIYLHDGTTELALVCTDLLLYSKQEVRQVREAVAEATGMPAGHIMVTASHSHSSPRTAPRLDRDGVENIVQPDPAYQEEVRRKLTACVIEAREGAFEAKLGTGRGYCGREQGVGGNRHHPQGPADPEVWVIGVQDSSGAWRGCLVKYALHPTVLHSDNLLVSADYPGYIRSYFQRHLPGMAFLFAQGCSGNQSSRYFRESKTFPEADRIGSAIGATALQVLKDLALSEEVPLAVFSQEIDLPLRDLPPLAEAEAEADATKATWEAAREEDPDARDTWLKELRFLGAENTLGYARQIASGKSLQVLERELPAEIQVLAIGDSRLVALQGELFVEFGLAIQSRAPFAKCFVVELANGCLPGYACTNRAYHEGCYEAGTSMLTAAAGQVLVETALDLLEQSAT